MLIFLVAIHPSGNGIQPRKRTVYVISNHNAVNILVAVNIQVLWRLLQQKLLFTVLVSVVSMGSSDSHADDSYNDGAYDDVRVQRLEFQVALEQLKKAEWQEFKQSMIKLVDYPLYPYLEYAELQARLYQLPIEDVQRFLAKYPGTAVAEKLRYQWLDILVTNNAWQQYVHDWDPGITNLRLVCLYQRARYNTGDSKAALQAAKSLWLVGHSQPESCNPLFEEWIKQGNLTQDLAWQRFEMAMASRNIGLGTFIVNKYLINDFHALGEIWLDISNSPAKIQQRDRIFQYHIKYPEKVRLMVLQAIKRLARQDLLTTQIEWQAYREQMSFTLDNVKEVNHAINVAEILNADTSPEPWLLSSPTANEEPALTELRIRSAMRQLDWRKVSEWIGNLPAETQKTERWRYWRARASEQLSLPSSTDTSSTDSASPQNIYRDTYQELAKTRTFYGFLAADKIKAKYAMQNQPAPPNQTLMNAILKQGDMQRALELFQLNAIDDARREWRLGTRNFTKEELTLAAKIAEKNGWYEKAIQSMIRAEYWHDIPVRFPLAYKQNIIAAAQNNQLDPRWVYAIARQESSFTPDITSPAGAMGIMQVMPQTGLHTAQKIGISFKTTDLLEPLKNITIGSNYLKGLLKQFNGNRILATSAYNAGPNRVKQWLKNGKNNLAADVWIETIPYSETRGYVQNVLSFSVIYGYRMNTPVALLSPLEAAEEL